MLEVVGRTKGKGILLGVDCCCGCCCSERSLTQVRGRSGVEELALVSSYHGRRSNKEMDIRLEMDFYKLESITSARRKYTHCTTAIAHLFQ